MANQCDAKKSDEATDTRNDVNVKVERNGTP